MTETGELWVGVADPASGDSRFVLSEGVEVPSEQTASLAASPRAEILGPGHKGYHRPPGPARCSRPGSEACVLSLAAVPGGSLLFPSHFWIWRFPSLVLNQVIYIAHFFFFFKKNNNLAIFTRNLLKRVKMVTEFILMLSHHL